MICGKQIYKSRTEANAVLTGANGRNSRNTKGRLSISYFCEDCNGWHLASKSRNKIIKSKTEDVDTNAIRHKKEIRNNRKYENLIIRNFSSTPVQPKLQKMIVETDIKDLAKRLLK